MPQLITCLSNSYGRFGVPAAVEHLPTVGIHYLELPIRTEGVPSFFKEDPIVTSGSSEKELEQVQKLLDKHQMKLSSCNVTTGNPLERTVVETTKKKLDIAAWFGVTLVVGGAGEAEEGEQLETLYAHLREIGDYAAERNITYCFETHPGICESHYGMLTTMEALNHSHLKINFDTGNIYYYNENVNDEIALTKVCQHVAHIHLKDTNGGYKDWHFPALGNGGAVDFVRVLQIMRDCGFTGPYSLEIEGIKDEPTPSLELYQQRIADSVEHLRWCGYDE